MLPLETAKLITHPQSVSVNANFLSLRGKAIAYVYKTVPSIVAGRRLHPYDLLQTIEFMLKTHNVFEQGEWYCTFKAIDVLEIYSQEELDFILLNHEQQFQDKVLCLATKEEIEALEGKPYILGQNLLQRGKL